MKNFKIYAGLGGRFGGVQYIETWSFNSLDVYDLIEDLLEKK